MINRRNYKNICVLLALTSISCSDSEGWMSSIPLSNEKISFTASLQEGWSGGQGSGDKSRAVKPDFPGLAREQKVLTTDEAFSKPLYLHPIETVNKTLKNQGPTTRGTMNNDPVVGYFRVSANYIQNEGSKKEESFFQDREAKKEGSNNNWFVADNVKWPAAGTVSFYAYAPYNVSSLQWKGVDDVTKNKTIHYEVPTNVEDQPDFIVANSEGKSFNSSSANTPVALNFSHALTAITFSVSDDMEKGKINSITIEGVKGEGDYNLSTNEWTVSSSSAASYNVPISAGGLTVGTETVDLAANATLMMIPQTLGDDAKVTINITPTGKSTVDLTFDLKGTQWVAGNHVTYLLSTTKIIKLNMGSVNYPKWQTAEGSAFTSEKLKSSYVSGDALGMYIVDKNHKVVKANVQLTTTDGNNWNFSSSQKFTGSLSYDYFLYYPYQTGGLAGAPKEGEAVSVNSVTNQISASDFFSGAIEEWSKSLKLKTDQGDDVKFNSCDLQIGKGELEESSSTVAFPTMTHAMGLAHVKLGKRSLSGGVTYISNNDFGPNIKPYTWGGNIAYASSEVDGRKLFPLAKYDYACIVSPGISTEFNTASGVKNAWEKALAFTPSTNKVQMQEALVADTGSGSTEDYTIQLGDIYYNDGSISHDLDETDKHYPVGIIVYLAKDNGVGGKLDYWVETNTKNADVGGHGLVMCLKTIGSTGPTNFGNNYAWYSSSTDAGLIKVTSKSDIVNSKNQPYGSGYTNTNYLINKWGVAAEEAAAYQAKNYKELPAPSAKCTGWFLPSAGQCYAAFSQCGGMSSDWDFDFDINVTTEINDMLEKVGDSNYTVFFLQGSYFLVWTSSEYSSDYAVVFGSGVNDSKGSGSVRFTYYYKVTQRPVRPFLAF